MTPLTSVLLQVAILASGPQSYDQAHKAAMESGQPLLVLVGAQWCPACANMKTNVVPELLKRGSFQGVQFAQVDIDQQRELAGRLSSAGVIPQLILYRKTSEGWRRWEVTGGQSPEAVVEFIHNGVEQIAKTPESSKSAETAAKSSDTTKTAAGAVSQRPGRIAARAQSTN